MALANVAVCLYRRGARVLVVDWDLEAPGLENFFFDSEAKVQDVKSQFGVIDMLLDYKRQYSLVAPLPAVNKESAGSETDHAAAPLRPFDQVAPHLLPLRSLLYPIFPPQSPSDTKSRALWLLPSGWRSTGRKTRVSVQTGATSKDERFSKYAEAVQSFDWAEFYTHFDGESYFSWFREQLLPVPSNPPGPSDSSTDRLGLDAVLIDSRTGVTEMGGVCTRQLADVIVSFCAPNYQNLDGVARMSESFVREDLRKFRGGRLPEVVVVPARIDLQGETSEQNKFHTLFDDKLRRPLAFEQLGLNMWDLRIPYATKYAYREALAVGVPDSNKTLEKAYVDLTTRLVLLSTPGSNLQIYFAPDLLQLKRAIGTPVADEHLSGAEDLLLRGSSALAGFTSHEEAIARRVLTRLVNVVPEGGTSTRVRINLNDFGEAEQAAARRLVDLKLLAIEGTVGDEKVQLAHEALISHWPKLDQWLQEDREFLLWRQRLRANVSTWEERRRAKSVLLPKDLAAEAAKWMELRPEDLTPIEAEFIEFSKSQNASLFNEVASLVRAVSPVTLGAVMPIFVLAIIVVNRSERFIRSSRMQTFLWGLLGALTVSLLGYVRNRFTILERYEDERGSRTNVSYWLLSVASSLLGGMFAFLFQTGDQPMTASLALYIGAAAPLLIRELVLVPSPKRLSKSQ